MPKERPPSSMNLPPTYRQKQTIITLLAELRTIAKHEPTNRWEARDFIYKLRIQKKEMNNGRPGNNSQTDNGNTRENKTEPKIPTQYR